MRFLYGLVIFHLLLNLDEAQNFEYPELIKVLENMIQRLELQRKLTNSQGIVKLHIEDEVIQMPKRETVSSASQHQNI